MARLAGEHWFRPSWWPWQDAGVPFEHLYMPLVPAAAAIAAKLGRVPVSRGFFTVMGLVLCLGPATLFLLLRHMTGSVAASFWAVLAWSITSPARAVLPEGDVDPIRYWSSHRLYNAIVWDDLPHHTAMLFFPLAVLFLWRTLETRRLRDGLLAVVCICLTVLASVFGATALALATACMLVALGRGRLRTVAAIAAVSYAIVCPFLPPSLILTIRSNQQRFVEDRWSAGSLIAMAVVLFGGALLSRIPAKPATRFLLLFSFVAAAIPLADAWLGSHFVPQPNRYTAEMEIGAAMVMALTLAKALPLIRLRLRVAVAIFVSLVCIQQIASLRRFTEMITRPKDPTAGIEYRLARWMEGRYRGARVMVPGSVAQWFNVFTDTPQLSGASYSTTPNWNQQYAMTSVLTALTRDQAESAVLWLKAFGVQAATVAGPKSSEFWKGRSSTKFDGLLPVLWRPEDTTVYGVPQRSPSLAHVVPADALGDLRKYVAALDDPVLPVAEMRWRDTRHFTIETTIHPGQVVSVQTSYHRGWHAAGARTRRDGLGLLVIEPSCDGPCRIEMTYDGGWEYLVCRVVSYCALIGLFALGAYQIVSRYYRQERAPV
jgi:hypothetical protein